MLCLDTLPFDPLALIPDLDDLDAMELANRAVLVALSARGCLIVDIVFVCDEKAAGVECIGSDSRETLKSSVVSERPSAESSITGIEGRDGISCPSISCILLHTREGVSRIAAMIAFSPESIPVSSKG